MTATTINPTALPSLPLEERAARPEAPAARSVVEGDIIDAAVDNDSTSKTVGALEPRELSLKETAHRMRSELRERYPASHFSVRCETGYDCRSVTIRYVDGPSRDEVSTLSDAYLGYVRVSGGLDDDRDYRPLPGQWVGGEFIRYGIAYVSIDRDTSERRVGTPADIERLYFREPTTTLAIAEAYLGMSSAAVVKRIKAGTLKATRGRGNQWVIDVASLRVAADRRAVPSALSAATRNEEEQ